MGRLALAVLPLFLGFAALYALDRSDSAEPLAVREVEAVDTRLFVVMIDSLDYRDVASLPALQTHKPGLHGRVRACVDGVTIPCVSAMVRGLDRASGFSPLRNFGAARDLAEHSLLGALQRHGRRVGYFGDPLLAKALTGLHMVYASEKNGPADDADTLDHALTASDGLDLVFIHLLAIDETAHKFGAQSAEFARALRETDTRIERVFARQTARDHVVVLGDHGHELSGRHSADVGTETYAAYYGPHFAHPRERAMVMTDHASIWAGIFGLHMEVSGSSQLASRARAKGPLLIACAIALAIALSARPTSPRNVLGAFVMLGLGGLYRLAYDQLAAVGGKLLAAVVTGVVGMLALGSSAVTGALLFALPTAEPAAGIKAPVLWMIVALLRRPAERMRLLAASGLFALALVRVREYLPRSLLEVDVGIAGSSIAALFMLVAVGRGSALLALVAGQLLAFLTDESARWWIAPCALVLPLSFASFRWPRAFPLTCFVLPLACNAFFPHDTAQLAAVSATWLLWLWLPAALRDESSWLRASGFVLLMWLSFWAAMSTRVGGVDYDFYFRWLPANEGATGEAGWQGMLTAAKCMLPVVFGALLATRAGTLTRELIEGAESLTRLRLAFATMFVVGLSWTHAAVNVPWIYDATQEIAFWILMIAVLGLVALAHHDPPHETGLSGTRS